MANAYTSTEMLANLKRRGMIPSSTATFTAADFYKLVDDETQTYIVPLLLEVREEYLVSYSDVSIVTGTTEYDLPERAIAMKVRSVSVSGRPLVRYEPETVDTSDVSTAAAGYYLRGNNLVLTGAISGDTLRIAYYQRPSRVVATTAVGEITVINTGTGELTLASAVPSTFTTGVTYDLVKAKPGFDTLGKDFTASAVGASSVTVSGTLPTGLAVGDFLCLSQETPVPQIPVEMHALLAQRVAATVLHSLGDDKAKPADKRLEQMEKQILKVISPRSEGTSRVVVNRYGVGRPRGYRSRGY